MRSIAILTPTFPPYRGGIGKVAEQDARQLAEAGLDVHVYAPAGRGGVPDPAAEPGASYAVHRLRPLFRYGNAAFVPGAAGLLRRHGTVLLHYPFFGGAEPLVAAKRLGGKGKLIVSYHMDVFGAGALKALFSLHSRFIMPSIVREADRVLVTSGDYARHGRLAKLYAAEPERFRELPPSVDVDRFAPGEKPKALLERHGLAASDQVIVSVGGMDRAHYFKGVPSLLRALSVRELAKAKAVLVGEGDLRPSFVSLARELGVADRVIFAGGVSEAELPAYHRLADVFAFPSTDRSEAFGIAALEAMASGVPVVASDLPGVRTIVREGITGLLVPPGSASALTFRLAALMADGALRRKLGESARRMAVDEYSDDRRAARWEKIIAELRI